MVWAFFIFGVGFGIVNAMNSQSIAMKKLAHANYKDITMTGWQPIALWCDSKAGIAQGFVATTASGERREGYVCTSLVFSYIVD